MTESFTLSCPNGCVSLDVSGQNALRDDREFLEDVAVRDNPTCPRCGEALDG